MLTLQGAFEEVPGHDVVGQDALEGHRRRDGAPGVPLWCAMVTRVIPASSPEFRCEEALKAQKIEKEKLLERRVWLPETVREWSDVVRDDSFDEALCGRVFVIMGYKGDETTCGKYKARGVFAGNNVQTKSGTPAAELYQEISSCPATAASARIVSAIAALRGLDVTARDGESAYTQSSIRGPGRPPCWVRLPRTWWPKEWFSASGVALWKDPVVELSRALYGHPEAEALWEKHLGAVLRQLGWVPVEGWPGVWLMPSGKGLLIVYVDDLLLAAARGADTQALWKDMEQRIAFKDPPEDLSKYLGTNYRFEHVKIGADRETRMFVEMKAFLEKAVDLFQEELGKERLVPAGTPYVAELTAEADEEPGVFAKTSASHLMRMLFAARMARPDLITAITRLASHISRWKVVHDGALKRILSYCGQTLGLELCGSLRAGDISTVEIHVYPDADLGGDGSTTKSTAGLWVELATPDSSRSWPVMWSSRKQACTASSTCEAETLSLDSAASLLGLSGAVRKEGAPLQALLSATLGRPVRMIVFEDNTQCIAAVRRGYSASLRHLPRTQRLALGVMHEIFYGDEDECGEAAGLCELRYCESKRHKGDVFTKVLPRGPFRDALARIGMRGIAGMIGANVVEKVVC